MLDLNQLFARHQIALINAQQAGVAEDRSTYRDLAAYYADRIRVFRADRDMPDYHWA